MARRMESMSGKKGDKMHRQEQAFLEICPTYII
jgi:hypothetical protein